MRLPSAVGLLPSLLLAAFFDVSLPEFSYDVVLLRGLLANYDWKLRPVGKDPTKMYLMLEGKGGPLVINVNILLRTISKIDDVNMEFSTQFTFRQTWNDKRLAYANLVPSEISAFEADAGFPNMLDQKKLPEFIILIPSEGPHSEIIWLPDTFFQNEKSAQKHMIDKPNILIRIYPNGDVLYSVRLSLILSCPMSLADYPMDKQDCFVDFSSYAYTIDDIQYRWSNDTPVQMKDTVKTSLPSFDLGYVLTKECISNTSTGEYSCLRVHLHFQRMFSYYLLQLYIPSFMLVIVSWVSFWVDKSSVPARVTLGVTTLLTITTQASGVNAKLPPVSYTKAIDVWIGVCLAFVFGALLEYALVNYADEGHIGRRFSDSMARSSTHERTFAEAATASEISPVFLHYGTASELQSQQVQQKRVGISLNGNYGHSRLVNASPLLGRNNSYRWGEDEEAARRFYIYPTDHRQPHHYFPAGTSTSPCFPVDLHPVSPCCPRCCVAPAGGPPIRSFARRRLVPVSGRWKQSKLPLYKQLGSWAVSLYNEADRAKKIDVVSRVVFPFLFLCFNCVYWTVY